MAESSSKQYFKISQGTKYLTAASGRDHVTLEAKRADFRDTQVWEKKKAFFLFSKSAFVQQPPPADNRTIALRTPAKDELWTESHREDELIYIQKASDTNLVKERTYGTVVVLPQKRTGSVDPPNPKETSHWKMEPWNKHKGFTISPRQSSGTKYLYLTASSTSRDVTLEAKKDEKAEKAKKDEKAEKAEKADFDDSQLWEKKEAFFLVRPSKTDDSEDVLVELPDRTVGRRQTPAMDGLWTESHPVNELICIQKASDPELVLDATSGEVALRRKCRVGPIPTSLWKMEPWKRKVPADRGSKISHLPPTDINIRGLTGVRPEKTDPKAAGASISHNNNTNKNPAQTGRWRIEQWFQSRLRTRHGKKPNNNTNKNPARTTHACM